MKALQFFIILLTAGLQIIHSQDRGNRFRDEVDVYSSTPQISSLLSENLISENLYTGSYHLSIPIFKGNVRGLPVNVSLDYSTNGVTVSEEGGDVGMTWNLNAGGFIARALGDKADDEKKYGSLSDNSSFYKKEMPEEDKNRYIWEVMKGHWDSKQDIFYYNILGMSGKFIIHKDSESNEKKIFQMPKTNNRISFSTDKHGINSFTIIDDKGYRYLFNESSHVSQTLFYHVLVYALIVDSGSNTTLLTIKPDVRPGDSDFYRSHWYLKEIRDYNEIPLARFSYNFVLEKYDKILARRRNQLANCAKPYKDFSYDDDRPAFDQYMPLYTTDHLALNVLSMKLKKIDLVGKGSIDFVYQNGRDDYLGGTGSILKEILINSSQNGLVKKYLLDYKLTVSSLQEDYHHSKEAKSRYFLKKLIEVSSKGNKKTHEFSYYGSLPSKLNKGRDHYGYYNNEKNSTFFPHDNPCESGANSANRKVNENYVHYGGLKKVVYPTGGFTEFEYEPNNYNFVNEEEVPNVIKTKIVSKYFEFDSENMSKEYLLHCVENYSSEVILKSEAYAEVLNTLSINLIPVIDNGGSYVRDTTRSILPMICYEMSSENLTFKQNFYFRKGLYLIKMESIGFTSDPSIAHLNLSIPKHREAYDTEKSSPYGPGIRIKEIRNYNKDNVLAHKKSYNYNFFGTKKSSGSINAKEQIYSYMYYYGSFNNSNYDKTKRSDLYRIINDMSQSPYPLSGNIFGYKNVEVKENEGISQYTFTSSIDYPTNFEKGYSFRVKPDEYWRRGLLEKIVKKNGAGKILSKTEVDNNSSWQEESFYKDYYFYRANNPFDSYHSAGLISYNMYKKDGRFETPSTYIRAPSNKLLTGASRRVKEKETMYYDNDSINTYKTFHYSPTKLILHKKCVKNSPYKFNIKLGYKSICYDYVYSNQFLNEHNVLIPSSIKTSTIEFSNPKNLTISKEAVEYKEYSNKHYHKYKLYKRKGEGENLAFPSEKDLEITYDRYDSKGNLEQYTTVRNRMPVTIIWGYNNHYPIAKIEGVKYEDIPAVKIAEIKNASNMDTDDCLSGCSESDLRNLLNSLRNYFPKTMITTYTYNPLIGVTSITPPNGQTVYYQYDDFGRLNSIKDESGSSVKDVEYHYKVIQ